MTDSDDHLVREANVSTTRDGNIVSFELERTELLAMGRHGEEHDAVPVLG